MTRKFAKFACGLMACSALTTPAFAQEQDAEADATARNDNVIIVTATRRAQDVQDIPLAVTAIAPQQLEAQRVVNIQQVAALAPSFTSSQAQLASGSVVLRVRGVGTTSNNIGFESAVGIFIDGAYQCARAWRSASSSTWNASKCCAARRARCSAATPRPARSTSPTSART